MSMGGGAPEFSRPVRLARIGSEPYRIEITADEAERAALARRFDLLALDRLQGVVELHRQGGELILLQAEFEAAFEQSCIVTLDPIAGAVVERFALLYGPLDQEEAAVALVGEDVAFEPITGDTIDIGEAVAQEFSLSLPPFPRSPDASVAGEGSQFDAGEGSQFDELGPFAGLSRLSDRNGGEPQ